MQAPLAMKEMRPPLDEGAEQSTYTTCRGRLILKAPSRSIS
jgi:hypothetical protein